VEVRVKIKDLWQLPTLMTRALSGLASGPFVGRKVRGMYAERGAAHYSPAMD